MNPTQTVEADAERSAPVRIPRTWFALTAALAAAEFALTYWLYRAPAPPTSQPQAFPFVDVTTSLMQSYPKLPHTVLLIYLAFFLKNICVGLGLSSRPEDLERIGSVLRAALVITFGTVAMFFCTL